MTIEDFVWIARELPRLEALDLSDSYSAQDDRNVDDKAKIFRWRQVVNDIAETGEIRVILTKGDVDYFTCLDRNEKTHYGNRIFELRQRTRQTPGNDLEKLELYNICEQLLDRERVAQKKAEELDINKLVKRMGEAGEANKPLTASDEVEGGQDPKKLEWVTLMQKLDPISRPRNLKSSPPTQKMASKLPHKNTSSNPQAMPLRRNGTAPTPLSSDSDAPEHPPAANPSLVQLARHAALAREAVGWLRFWATYALRFGALTLLRVRMPKAFDRVWSYRLARLLDQELGWRVVYFDEERRPHADSAGIVHVERDGLFLRSWRVESLTPPSGGMFVRRTRFWGWRERADKWVGARVLSERGDRMFVLGEWESTDEVESSELEKAIERANAATMREQAASSSLTTTGCASPSDRGSGPSDYGSGPSSGGGSPSGGGGPPYRYYRSSTPSIPDDTFSVHSSPEANPNGYQGSHRQGLPGLVLPLSDLPSSGDEPGQGWLITGGVDDYADGMPRPPPLDTHSDHPNPLPPPRSLLSHQPSGGDEPGDQNWPGARAAGPSNQGVAGPASAGPVYNGGDDQGLFGDDGLFNNVPDAEQPERAPADRDQPTADAPRVPPLTPSRSTHAAEVAEAQRYIDEARRGREERRAGEALRVQAVAEQRARIGREYQEIRERERAEKEAEEKRRNDEQEAQARGAEGEAQRPDDDAPGDAEESEEEEAPTKPARGRGKGTRGGAAGRKVSRGGKGVAKARGGKGTTASQKRKNPDDAAAGGEDEGRRKGHKRRKLDEAAPGDEEEEPPVKLTKRRRGSDDDEAGAAGNAPKRLRETATGVEDEEAEVASVRKGSKGGSKPKKLRKVAVRDEEEEAEGDQPAKPKRRKRDPDDGEAGAVGSVLKRPAATNWSGRLRNKR